MRYGHLLSALLLVASCSQDKEAPCKVGTSTGCDTPLVCEEADGKPVCVPEFALEGSVRDSDGEGISAAHVVALDANGTALGSATSEADGAFRVAFSWPRDAEFKPLDPPAVTLRVSASGYQAFPLPPRVAIPIDLSKAELDAEETRYVVANSTTNVMLLPLQGDSQGLATIRGTVTGENPTGVLLVATQAGSAVSSGVSGHNGEFVLFNVPEGATELLAFKAGVRYPSQQMDVEAPVLEGVQMQPASGGLTRITGSVQLVNTSGSFNTSVLLVPEVLFEPMSARGESPAGMRADDVTGAFAIDGVPPGRFVALAAFENDGLVRDPDTAIAGTDIVVFETTVQGGELPLGEQFKITGALDVVSPGAAGMDTVDTLPITFQWKDDSSEKGYDLVVYDAYGNVAHQADDLPSVSGGKDGNPLYVWQGLDAVPGMIYQFRVRSWRGDTWDKTYISQTEDLKGLFLFQPAL